jgi:hypothetical protein
MGMPSEERAKAGIYARSGFYFGVAIEASADRGDFPEMGDGLN